MPWRSTEQPPGTARVVLEEGAGCLVLGDVGVDQEDAAVLGGGIALGDVGLAGAQRFHLGAGQGDAGLPGVLDAILEARLAVLGNALAAVVLAGRHGPRLAGKGRYSAALACSRPTRFKASSTAFLVGSVSGASGSRHSGAQRLLDPTLDVFRRDAALETRSLDPAEIDAEFTRETPH